MIPNKVISLYQKSALVKEISSKLSTKKRAKICISSLVGSMKSFYSTAIFKTTKKTFLFVLEDKEQAAYFLNELEQILSSGDVLFFPSSYTKHDGGAIDRGNVLLRAEVLTRINDKKPTAIVTYPCAIAEKVVTKKHITENSFDIKKGDSFTIDFLNENLYKYEFSRVDFVSEPGEFSVRGGIVDVFSFSNDNPYRVEFFGDEVDSIRTFDIEDQLSIEKVDDFVIIPNIESKNENENREGFMEYISRNTVIVLDSPEIIKHKLNLFIDSINEKKGSQIYTKNLFVDSDCFFDEILKFPVIEFSSKSFFGTDFSVKVNAEPQPSFNKNFDLLISNLKTNKQNNISNLLLCANEKQVSRFRDIFEDMEREVEYSSYEFSMHEGFVDYDNKLAVYTDHQIFERYHKYSLKSVKKKVKNTSLEELSNLSLGDYVTHIDYGIGKYGGLQKIEVDGNFQEAIKLIYLDNDLLYVSIHSMHKLSKFSGKDSNAPKINKLGSPVWKALKKKTKTKVKKIAFDLIQLYAKRKSQKGFQYSPDTYLQHELEASFIYEDTPDQFSATKDVKADMESERPMDRLICGDVGFGKTEVAIRAAFKAATDGKQVVVLVPTTILAYQHFRTFSQRLKDMPVNIDYLNRFRTAKQKKGIIDKLKSGQIDIIIGTHQLVNKRIQYRDLGLLIVDEEQKFGVSIKEKLKDLKSNVDTLTLTATPIPRTLQFSLMAARDLSVINTPPPNRYPIETHVVPFEKELIRGAIQKEVSRGGQVFFIHNRIENIEEVANMIRQLVPEAKVCVGHGRMKGDELEKIILDFVLGDFDILVSTTIVENGIDVPNANTIMINRANSFGLSDLHQMRGRVGRSNKKAFCYFIAPPYSAMTDEARKRLAALDQYSSLGQGFNIAMKDLEIRGAGDILGGEQSGFITEMGFDTYQKILSEAISELKENDFKDLFETKKDDAKFVKKCQIDTDFEILIPDDYISNITERLSLYNKLNSIQNENELTIYKNNLEDRFGEVPYQVLDLLNSVRIKWMATELGFERLVMKKTKFIAYFISDQKSDYFNSEIFSKILIFVQKYHEVCKLKEKQNKSGQTILSLVIDNIHSVDNALGMIEKMNENTLA